MQIRKKYKAIILFILLTIIVYMNTTSLLYANNMNENIQVTAHRGSSTFYPDNTFVSIDEAIIENADYVEIDVRTTKDNQVVVFHDKTLKRVANNDKEIKDMTLEEVKLINNGSYKNKLFYNEKVPTLEEIFAKYKNKGRFNLDLKVRDEKDVLPEEVARLIEKYDMHSQVIVTCFNKDIIEKYKKDNPKDKTGFIIGKNMEGIEKVNSDIISLKYELLSKEMVGNLHNNNKEIHVWTLNNINKIDRAIDLGVDNIITNNVNLVKGILRYKNNTQ